MSDLNRYYVKLKLTYEYEVIATSSEQAEEISTPLILLLMMLKQSLRKIGGNKAK